MPNPFRTARQRVSQITGSHNVDDNTHQQSPSPNPSPSPEPTEPATEHLSPPGPATEHSNPTESAGERPNHRRVDPIDEEEPPPDYTPAPAAHTGELTLEVGPNRPFTGSQAPQQQQQPPRPQYPSSPPNSSSYIRPQPTGSFLSPQQTGNDARASPSWLRDLTSDPAIHRGFSLARQVTGGIRRELADMAQALERENQRRQLQQQSQGGYLRPQQTGFMQPQRTGFMQPQRTGFMQPQRTGWQPQRMPGSYSSRRVSPPLSQRHHIPPPLPPRPSSYPSPEPTPQSDFAREFYAAGPGEPSASVPHSYSPPPGPPPHRNPTRRRSRSVDNFPAHYGTGNQDWHGRNPSNGRPDPTSQATPGHPLLHGGRLLVYTKRYQCPKCQNTGYAHLDPSNPCKKCWRKYGKKFEGAVVVAYRNSEEESDEMQRPLPRLAGSGSRSAI